MPKKASLVPKISHTNVKHNNNDIYVYERITKYNLEKRFNEVVSSQLISKIAVGSTEVAPTRPRRNNFDASEIISRDRLFLTKLEAIRG
jgi:hypothetical protein